jgi:hypothetical protein
MHQEPSGVWIMAYTTIDNPFKYFNTVLYTGNGSTQSITGVGFQPDWVWGKERGGANSHMLADSVRGATKILFSNLTNAEDTDANSITSFDSDGFGIGSSGNLNASSDTYVAWNWLAGGSASSNSDGSITSSVSANTTAGFSIVSYTGTGANATVGHGLGTNMDFAIFKLRSGSSAWLVYHKSLGATKAIYLNETGAVGTNSSGFNDTEPTSSVFSLGNGATANTSGGTQIAYCFAEKKGFSKFGSYTGNGNADGTFVYTGFKPAFVMVKVASGTTGNWQIQDSKRDGFNENKRILANVNEAEKTSQMWDQLSNGFKIRVTSGDVNGSGNSYIYMAFAESPFVTAGTKAAGTAR